MKSKIAVILILIVSVLCVSCTAAGRKEISQTFSYQDPQTIGGRWDVFFDNGDTYRGVKCLYWGTNDDTSVWESAGGMILIQSGTVHAVQTGF